MDIKEILAIVEKANEVHERTKSNENEPSYWARISDINLFADHIKKIMVLITGHGQIEADGYRFSVGVKEHKFALGHCYEWDIRNSIGTTIGELSAFINKMDEKDFRLSMLGRLDGVCVKIIGERVAYVQGGEVNISVVESISKNGVFLENGITINEKEILDASEFEEIKNV